MNDNFDFENIEEMWANYSKPAQFVLGFSLCFFTMLPIVLIVCWFGC